VRSIKKYIDYICQMVRTLKELINEIFFGIISFVLALVLMTCVRYLDIIPEQYWLRLLIHIVEIVVILFILKKVYKHIPLIFQDVPSVRDVNLYSPIVLMLVDWSIIDRFTQNWYSK